MKNAYEAAGPGNEVRLTVEEAAEGGFKVTVLDRGAGMSDEALQSALYPFYTTKPGGSGLGLALCPRDPPAPGSPHARASRRWGHGGLFLAARTRAAAPPPRQPRPPHPHPQLADPARSAGYRLPEKTIVAHRACGAERLEAPKMMLARATGLLMSPLFGPGPLPATAKR